MIQSAQLSFTLSGEGLDAQRLESRLDWRASAVSVEHVRPPGRPPLACWTWTLASDPQACDPDVGELIESLCQELEPRRGALRACMDDDRLQAQVVLAIRLDPQDEAADIALSLDPAGLALLAGLGAGLQVEVSAG